METSWAQSAKHRITLLRFNDEAQDSTISQRSSHTESSPAIPQLRCSTILVPVDEAPSYIALSYAWGDLGVTSRMLLDDKVVEITASLESALCHFKDRIGIAQALWVDYLCIDQEDEIEKSQQVSQMREIYANASKVLIWLGPRETCPDMALAVDWIEHFGSRAERLRIGKTAPRVLRKLLSASGDCTTGAGAQDLDQEELSNFVQSLTISLDPMTNACYERLMAALRNFLSVTYWKRIWVVQEVAVATTHDFIYGSRSLTFMCLRYAVRLLRNFRYWQLTTTAKGASQQHHLADPRRALPIDTRCAMSLIKTHDMKTTLTLMLLLRRFIHFKSSDPRDRVFALLGIAKDADKLGIVPDYTKALARVYTEAARALLQHGFFDIFSYCGYYSTEQRKMQSWVPDWSRAPTRCPLQLRICKASGSYLMPEFHASRYLRQPASYADKADNWDAALRLHAVQACTVTAVGSPWETEGHGRWLHSLHVLSESASVSIFGYDKLRHAVWSTALAGQELRREDTKPRVSAATIMKLDRAVSGQCLSTVTSSTLVDADLAPFAEAMQEVGEGRRTFLTSTGKLACGPEETRIGDVIVIVPGAQVPFVLRKWNNTDRYIVLGEAYVHGYMDGEAVNSNSVIESLLLC